MRPTRLLKRISVLGGAALLLVLAGVLWIRLDSTSATIRSSAARASTPEDLPQPDLAVRIASYNAWLLPIGADDTEERRDAMGPAIDALEPDVLCLQEVWTDAGLDALAEALADRLPDVARSGGGLAILSRWPIRDAVFDEFPASTAASLTEWLARKGVLTVQIDTPAGPLRVVNTHLAFDRSDGREDHAAQLAILLDALRGRTDRPTILCGDLNLRGTEDGMASEGFSALRQVGFEDAASVGSNGQPAERQGTRVGWPRAGRRARWDPDYVLFRSGVTGTLSVVAFRQALDSEQTALSDHNLLLADIVLRPTATPDEATATER